MMKKVLLLFLILGFLFLDNTPYAQASKDVSTSSAMPESVDAFSLFWPVTAGKTIDDPLYFLKGLKEKIRGALIFGQGQKANYETLLATKRILEAKKLFNENKSDLAKQTLLTAQTNLNNVEGIISSNSDLGESGGEIIKKLTNLKIYLNFLIVKKSKTDFQPLLEKVEQLLKKLTT